MMMMMQVVKNLNVHNGKFSLAEWYRNGGALDSSKDSTQVFFFFTLVTGPRRSLSLKLSDTRVYEP